MVLKPTRVVGWWKWLVRALPVLSTEPSWAFYAARPREVVDAEWQFLKAARLHGFHMVNGWPRQTNAAYDSVVAAREVLRSAPDGGQRFLIGCLADSDPSVVTWAALYLLPTREGAAVRALKRVARSDAFHIGFDAEMTLEEWQAGRLTVE